MSYEGYSDSLSDEQRIHLGVFCVGGGSVGLGHVCRCSALIQESLRRGMRCSMIVDDRGIPSALLGESALAETELIRCDWATAADLCERLTISKDLIIVDSYQTTPEVRATLCPTDRLSLIIDDLRIGDYSDAAVILNSSPDASVDDYKNLPASSLILGPSFAPLRKTFWQIDPYVVSPHVRSLLVTTGGAVAADALEPLVSSIRRMFPKISVHQIPLSTAHILDAQSLLNTFADADLAITGGGQSLIELLRLGIPTISICLAENQRQNVLGFARMGATLYGGTLDDPSLPASLLNLVSRCSDARVRQCLSSAGSKAVDGLGARRTVDFLLRTMIERHLEIRTALLSDSQAILALSNLGSVRRVSHSTKQIMPDEHETWFRRQLESSQTIFLVAMYKSHLLGQFRLQCRDNAALVSASVHPTVRGMGIGSRMMTKGLEMLRQRFPEIRKVIGHPKLDNSMSQLYIEKAGFVRKGRQVIAGEEVYFYERSF